MDWKKLMSSKRYRGHNELKLDDRQEVRSPFMKDADRIIFSPEFRRLQDKTQVHLFPKTNFVRTRLTHSLETSTIGRSLGMGVGSKIVEIFNLKEGDNLLRASDFSSVVAAACLAHDIGNPPFGHAGEDAIKNFFIEHPDYFSRMQFEKSSDFTAFDGNAQGFRILTRLAGWRDQGGLRLTCATLGAFLKYPEGSTVVKDEGKEIRKKFSVFNEDLPILEEIVDELGLVSINGESYSRHPLAFLVEAADDICYLIADLEDGIQLKLIDYNQVEKLLIDIVVPDERKGLTKIERLEDRINYLRAKVIGVLIEQVQKVFIEDLSQILEGSRTKALLKDIPSGSTIDEIKKISEEKLYNNTNKIQLELAGYEIVNGLLGMFIEAIFAVACAKNKGKKPSPKHDKIYRLVHNLPVELDFEKSYSWLLRITDYIASLTDTGALNLYRKLKGIEFIS